MAESNLNVEGVRASRAGHTFHERWAARRALQLVFPKDTLFAIAVEGLSTNDTAKVGDEAADIADLILYFGNGDAFDTCTTLQTLQFKYKTTPKPATSSYLKKTVEKFCTTILDYEKISSSELVDEKLSFGFVTNGEFSDHLWEAIRCLQSETTPDEAKAKKQHNYLQKWCKNKGVDAHRLFSCTEFRASTKNLAAQNRLLKKTVSDWSAGNDSRARVRLFALVELLREKAGLEGQRNNLIKRESVLDALECEDDDLFPADTQFINVGKIVEREALEDASKEIRNSDRPVFVFADGGVGKTVFIQSLATHLVSEFEVVVFDCFGGGAYRSDDQARHLPRIGLVQIVNELASRGLCDPLLPSDSDRYGLIKVTRKRLVQASETVKQQSGMNGVLIVLDAADNAQLEAEHRNEDAFPKLLLAALSNDPIDGVKLLLTARPHRMDEVIGKSDVSQFELGPFSELETEVFLETRRESISDLERSTVFARSRGNARVLEYLVESWEQNVAGAAPTSKISVEELIAQRCEKIFKDLHIAGWSDAEVKEFFAAISLLPPPIPLNDLANALGWSEAQVNSAASDLAPMLELVKHGAIFRDEPTETYIRDTYSNESGAQQAIAQRLLNGQVHSMYAAEALPHFLVVIDDSDRAYELAKSTEFPSTIQSEYGRRRLKLARLYAAFTLAVRDKDFDRVLSLTMQLSQVASANAKGDQFIRRSPSLAIALGDNEVSRRLFNDRTGWRGARDARLTVAYSFLDDIEEASIHQNRAIGWINWYHENDKHDDRMNQSGPDSFDISAVIFLSVLRGKLETINQNFGLWKFQFALSVADDVIKFCMQYELFNASDVLQRLAKFAATNKCRSLALQIGLLSGSWGLSDKQLKSIARAASTLAHSTQGDLPDIHYDHEKSLQASIAKASFTALVSNSRQSSRRILKRCAHERPSSYDYDERHGMGNIWIPFLSSCVAAWAAGNRLTYYHLLPREIKSGRKAMAIKTKEALNRFLEGLVVFHAKKSGRKKQTRKRQFNSAECANISMGIELLLNLVRPIESAILSRKPINKNNVHDFLIVWEANMRTGIHWRSEEPKDNITRRVGIGLARLLLEFSQHVEEDDTKKLIDLIGHQRFTVRDKQSVLALIAHRPNLRDLTGAFAKQISEDIIKDEYIEQRGHSYSDLADDLVTMSAAEAKEYYKQGLSQLDQMGGDDYDLIYSILHYAAEQPGGYIKPELGYRLMNLCQTIIHHEPSKFGWTLFGRASAKSIGFPAFYKIVRWDDQDVADYSYGLPQLCCFLAGYGGLDAKRALVLTTLCEDHGWHEWQIGKGLCDLLEASKPDERRAIFSIMFAKLRAEHTAGGWDSLWMGLLECVEKYPNVADKTDKDLLENLREEAQRNRHKENARSSYNNSSNPPKEKTDKEAEEKALENAFLGIATACDPTSAHSIDEALLAIRESSELPFDTKNRLFKHLRANCPYDERADFTYAICEATELEIDDSIDRIIENVELWGATTSHLLQNTKSFVSRIFAFKGSELFYLRYSGIARQISRLKDFCGDPLFIMHTVLETIAKEQVELGGDEWLQIATSLCTHTSRTTSRAALEELLSGPAAKIGDEIGEGIYRPVFAGSSAQSGVVSDIIWHLLGDDDAFVRWTAAKAIEHLAHLGLFEDIKALFDRYDSVKIDGLHSEDRELPFQNSQQWFLMGLVRAAFYHGQKLEFIREKLESLANNSNLHVVNKIQVARCLANISRLKNPDANIQKLWDEINIPSHGYMEQKGYPPHKDSEADFQFDYEFNKHKVSNLARLFGISKNEATDAIAAEIKLRWPDAEDMDFFTGVSRYHTGTTDRYETYREHIQRHALLSAATTLVKSMPVARSTYDLATSLPWVEWFRDYDVSFEDGVWLSDRKDSVPAQAKKHLLSDRVGNQEVIERQEELLRKIGFPSNKPDQMVPIYGSWKSTDGVYVRFTSALTCRKGIVGRCTAFAKKPDHDIWLPTFDSDGTEDRHYDPTHFEPFIWLPEKYPIGIDEGDELATRGAAARPRLGIDLTRKFSIIPNDFSTEWRCDDGALAIKSQVWGKWEPDQDVRRQSIQDEGELLWASGQWLDEALSNIDKCLVYHIEFSKYKSTRNYDDATGVRAVYIGLKMSGKPLRYWYAKKASKTVY